MNNKILLLPVIGVTAFFMLFLIYTKAFGPIPFSVNSVVTQKAITFNVTGEGKVTAKPDSASIMAGIQAQASTVKSAQDQINAVINKVSQDLKQSGVNAEDIQTTNYNINPNYDYTGGSQKANGFSASTTLSIKVKDISRINDVIDEATANGANQISGISFEVSDKAKLENEARQMAVNQAKQKAADAAKIAGFKLGRIVNYSEGNPGLPRPIMMQALAAKSSGSPSTEVQPGSTDVTINVTLSYEIQ